MNSTTQFLPGFESLNTARPLPRLTPETHKPRGRSGKRGVMYTTSTVQEPGSSYMHREFRAEVWSVLEGRRCASVLVQANASDRVGYGFGTVLMMDYTGKYFTIGMNAEQMRSVGTALLAAANSCGAKWRK
jgi:hypothetical protein